MFWVVGDSYTNGSLAVLQGLRSAADHQDMPKPWQRSVIDRLAAGCNTDGSWGYRSGSAGSAEPTALAALALAAQRVMPRARADALEWLAAVQRLDGAVPVSADISTPCWPTGPAVLAWARAGPSGHETFAAPRRKAADWLLENRGYTLPQNPRLLGHDTTLSAWPWVLGTHSFVEPTSFGILALRAQGRQDHPRVREGVRLLLDRALPEGGWNYGNTRVLDNTLRPFPATSGLALAALAQEQSNARIEKAIGYLKQTLPGVRAPFSLGWGLVGLSAWGIRPSGWANWLAESAQRELHPGPVGKPVPEHDVLYDAMLLLADADDPLLY